MSNDTYQHKTIFSEKKLRHKRHWKDRLFAIDMQADFSFKFYTGFWINNTLYIMNSFINILLWIENSNHELHSLFFARYDERPSFHLAKKKNESCVKFLAYTETLKANTRFFVFTHLCCTIKMTVCSEAWKKSIYIQDIKWSSNIINYSVSHWIGIILQLFGLFH